MEYQLRSQESDDLVTITSTLIDNDTRRKLYKLGGWQNAGRGAFWFETTERRDAAVAAFTPKKSAHATCHYCGMSATGYGPFGEPVCHECGSHH
jgi:hypothetical protein